MQYCDLPYSTPESLTKQHPYLALISGETTGIERSVLVLDLVSFRALPFALRAVFLRDDALVPCAELLAFPFLLPGKRGPARRQRKSRYPNRLQTELHYHTSSTGLPFSATGLRHSA
jgi:hypothetical protein